MSVDRQYLFRRWSKVEEADLMERVQYGHWLTDTDMALELSLVFKRTPDAIIRKLKRISGDTKVGPGRRVTYVRWEDYEVAFLMDTYHTLTCAEIAEKLERPVGSIAAKANTLGLNKRGNYNQFDPDHIKALIDDGLTASEIGALETTPTRENIYRWVKFNLGGEYHNRMINNKGNDNGK